MSRSYYYYRRGVKKPRSKLKIAAIACLCFGVVGIGGLKVAELQPGESDTSPIVSSLKETASRPAVIPPISLPNPLPWPEKGIAAYSVPTDKLAVASVDKDKSVPIASLTKIITVLAVMREKPLEPGQQGPSITLTEKDIAIYNEYIRKDGTVTPVAAGQKITQYQAMQAIMHVSSNNMADMLAIWAFGSIENYTRYANNMLQELGLENTRVADDASGYSSNNVSTAKEIATLSFLYLQNPVLREITQQPQATIPIIGTIRNTNSFINEGDVFGLKAGFTGDAGRCFIVASIRKTPEDKEEISVAVVLGSDSITMAAKDAAKILETGNRDHDTIVK